MILIVEDDPATHRALPILLLSRGYTSRIASTLAEGLEQIKRAAPKFLLLDLLLPDGNGIEILEYIKSNNIKTKCAVVTAYLDDKTKLLGYPVLLKPIDFDDLLKFLGDK